MTVTLTPLGAVLVATLLLLSLTAIAALVWLLLLVWQANRDNDRLTEQLCTVDKRRMEYRAALIGNGIDPAAAIAVDNEALEVDAPDQMLWDNEWEDSDRLLHEAFGGDT